MRVGALRAAFVLGIVLCGTAALATTLVRLDELPELVGQSRRAVLARVEAVRYDYDERRLHSTFVTLRVEDPLYGELPPRGEKLEIKVYGAPVPMPGGARVQVDGTPEYRVGERYLLLLIGESEWGFTNTAGLFQGAFRVKEAGGSLRAESLGGNREAFGQDGLARWLDPARLNDADRRLLADPEATVPYALLRDAVVRLWDGGAR